MTPSEFKRRMKVINNLFNQLEKNLNALPQGLQEEILDYHSQDATLQYTIRWGQQASEEILNDSKKVFNKAKENYDI
jgi:hypothetical protein